MSITFDYSKVKQWVGPQEIEAMREQAIQARETLVNKTGAGNDFLGWVDLPLNYDKEEFTRIKAAAKKIQENSRVLVVIGIGGSYLGARAAIECLSHSFYNYLTPEQRKTPEIYFVGNNISGTYVADLIELIGERDFSVNVISKSGTTTEPAIAFRIFKNLLEKKYGKHELQELVNSTGKSKIKMNIIYYPSFNEFRGETQLQFVMQQWN